MLVIRTIVCFAFVACCASACGVVGGSPEPSLDDPASGDTGDIPLAASTSDVCWKRTTARGVGVIPSECPGAEKSGVLCYPLCPAGYKGVGPVCWQSCPEGYTDDGALCRRDARIISADTSA